MMFLGLMGLLLWLGTLLGLAGGAEVARVECAFLEKGGAGISAPAFASPAKCDSDKKHFVDNIPLSGAEIIATAAPWLCVLRGRLAPSALGSPSTTRESWHLGQGPPRA